MEIVLRKHRSLIRLQRDCRAVAIRPRKWVDEPCFCLLCLRIEWLLHNMTSGPIMFPRKGSVQRKGRDKLSSRMQVKLSPVHTIDKSMINFFDHETTARTGHEA